MLLINLLFEQTLTEGLLWARYRARHWDTGGQGKLGCLEAEHHVGRCMVVRGTPKEKIKTGEPSQVWSGGREVFLRRHPGRLPMVLLHGHSDQECLWSSFSVQNTDREKEIPFPSKITRDIGWNRSKAMRTSQLYFKVSSLASPVFSTAQGGK